MTPMTQEDKDRLSNIHTAADGKLRYGRLWEQFTVSKHVGYAEYKTERAGYLAEDGQYDSAIDDLLDAINSIRFAILGIRELRVDSLK